MESLDWRASPWENHLFPLPRQFARGKSLDEEHIVGIKPVRQSLVVDALGCLCQADQAPQLRPNGTPSHAGTGKVLAVR